MLIEDIALLAIDVGGELLGKPLVENLSDCYAHLSSALLTFPLVENELLVRNLL